MLLKKIKWFLWRMVYSIRAVHKLHCTPRFAWDMACGAEDYFQDDFKPKESFEEELTYWAPDIDTSLL